MPPPIANVPSGTSLGIDAPRLALLSVTTLESIATVPNAKMPPPSAKRPFGATALATLPVTVLLLRLMFDPGNEKIPQPSASLVTLEAHTLSLTIVLLSVSAPLVAIPPPRAAANGRSPLMQVMVMSRGQGMPESVAADGAVTVCDSASPSDQLANTDRVPDPPACGDVVAIVWALPGTHWKVWSDV